MSVRKRKDGGWQYDIVIWRGSDRIRERGACKDCRNKREAQEHERDRRAELDAGAPSGALPTFGEHAEQVHRVVTSVQGKHASVRTERFMLDKHVLPFLGHRRLDEIDAMALLDLRAQKVAANLAPATVNLILATVAKVLRCAVEWDLLTKRPTCPLLPLRETTPEFLDFDELPRFLTALDSGTWSLFGLTAARAGLRRGELLELRWGDIDLVKGTLRVQRAVYHGVVGTPKSGITRTIPLSRELATKLRRARQLRGPDDLVFEHPNHRRFTRHEIQAPLNRACKRAGLRSIGPHVLRHSFASHLIMRGVSIKVVQELLGHKDLKTTMRYAHLSPNVSADAVNLLDSSPVGQVTNGSRFLTN